MAAVDLIIFGASGDLSARKLFPALFQLERLNLLEADLRIAAVARTNKHSTSSSLYLRKKCLRTWEMTRRVTRSGEALLHALVMYQLIFQSQSSTVD
ncbi:hypothetical protein N9X89_00410 [Luminiphilus sp.]|nr:hypothetical protein [Luminiphilus sp.]